MSLEIFFAIVVFLIIFFDPDDLTIKVGNKYIESRPLKLIIVLLVLLLIVSLLSIVKTTFKPHFIFMRFFNFPNQQHFQLQKSR